MTEREFVQAHAAVASPPLLPELRLHLATEMTSLWQATEAFLRAHGVEAPYWAFAWAGGQGLARCILDGEVAVAGRRVLDFACGTALCGIAAARAGASSVRAVDVDRFAVEAARLNVELNGVAGIVSVDDADLVGRALAKEVDVVLAGDVCYQRPMTERVVPWLRAVSAEGVDVLLADPGRTYVPTSGLELVARRTVPTSVELEGAATREVSVFRVLP